MIHHATNVISKSVQFLNPGQTPVVTSDQPLYALAKKIQWQWPEIHAETKVVMLGGLHTEMAALRTIGDWLEGSGWTSAITETDIASAGTADSVLKASHVSRTRHAHQVTACSLHILMHKAYCDYLQELPQDEINLDFQQWQDKRVLESPQFQFWSKTLNFELLRECLCKIGPADIS